MVHVFIWQPFCLGKDNPNKKLHEDTSTHSSKYPLQRKWSRNVTIDILCKITHADEQNGEMMETKAKVQIVTGKGNLMRRLCIYVYYI